MTTALTTEMEGDNMFAQQKCAKYAQLSKHTTLNSTFMPMAVAVDQLSTTSNHSFNSNISFRDLAMKISTFCSSIVLIILATSPYAFADNSNATPKWYRYYNKQGVPTLSSTISEQHLQYGYDSLDKNMQVIKHFSPFSGQNYAKEQALREQATAQRIAERHLVETYVSSDRAASQRDREINDLDGQIKRSQQQTAALSATVNQDVTAAANLERQNKPIPASLKKQLQTNKDLLNQSQANVNALQAKREQSSKQFNDVITTLKNIEQRGHGSNNAPISISSSTSSSNSASTSK